MRGCGLRRVCIGAVMVTAMPRKIFLELRGVFTGQLGSRVFFAGVDEERERAEQKDGKAFHSERAEASGGRGRFQRKDAPHKPR